MDIPEMKIAKVGMYIRDEKPSFVRVACALRGMLDDVIQEVMNITLWSCVPEELKELVFARSPWPQIYRHRNLCRGWNQKLMSTKDSELMRACANAQPKLFALLAPGEFPGSFAVNMFDIASNRWHTFETSMGYDPKHGEIQAVNASDGGLMCLISKLKSKSKKPRGLSLCAIH